MMMRDLICDLDRFARYGRNVRSQVTPAAGVVRPRPDRGTIREPRRPGHAPFTAPAGRSDLLFSILVTQPYLLGFAVRFESVSLPLRVSLSGVSAGAVSLAVRRPLDLEDPGPAGIREEAPR